jgi:hypothetical protein
MVEAHECQDVHDNQHAQAVAGHDHPLRELRCLNSSCLHKSWLLELEMQTAIMKSSFKQPRLTEPLGR